MESQPIYLLLLLLFGALELFFGYRIFRFLVLLAGVFLGFAYGPDIYAALVGPPGPGVALLAALIGAALFGLLAWFAFWGAVFLWGAALGYSLSQVAFGDAALLALIVAVVVGILAVVLERFLIVALTALNGAWIVVSVPAFWLGFLPEPANPVFDRRLFLPDAAGLPILILMLILAVVGAAFQFRNMDPEERGRLRRYV